MKTDLTKLTWGDIVEIIDPLAGDHTPSNNGPGFARFKEVDKSADGFRIIYMISYIDSDDNSITEEISIAINSNGRLGVDLI